MHRLTTTVLTLLVAAGAAMSLVWPVAAAQTPPSEQEALTAADGIFQLAADRDFNGMYDRIHPDAHEVIPRVAAVKTFEEAYGATEAGKADATGVSFIDWTWPVTGKAYSNTAEVTFTQTAVNPSSGQAVEFTDRMYLVKFEDQWRWFFGNSKAFIAEAIGKYAPPPPSEQPSDTGALLDIVVQDLDNFYKQALSVTDVNYQTPGVVSIGQGQTANTGCGLAQSGFWAFYCPVDQTVYLDEPFLTDLNQRYGDFAVAFVVAHEWAHHAQTTLGIKRSDAPTDFFEVYSIQLELSADCFAGAWTQDADTRGLLDPGDLVEAMAFTNERLGDPDTVDPSDPQAHGNSDQRVDAIQLGYDDGFSGCETIVAPSS